MLAACSNLPTRSHGAPTFQSGAWSGGRGSRLLAGERGGSHLLMDGACCLSRREEWGAAPARVGRSEGPAPCYVGVRRAGGVRGGDLDLGEIGSMWRRRDRNRRRQEKILGQFSPGERGSARHRREKNGGRRMNFLRSASADEFFAPRVGGRRCERSSGGWFFCFGIQRARV